MLGANILPARVLRPTDKQSVERAFGACRSLLFEQLLGYTGVDVFDRGVDPEADAVLTVEQMEHLIATWIVGQWQNRQLGEHAPCWDPAGDHSPNTLFAAAMGQGGFPMEIPAPELYYQLLPAHYVAIHGQRGVKIFQPTAKFRVPAVGFVRGDPCGGNPGIQSAGEHPLGKRGLGCELCVGGHGRLLTAFPIAGPGLGRGQFPVDQGASFACGISTEHRELAVLDAPGGAGVLALNPCGFRALLQESGLVHDQDPVACAQMRDGVVADVIADAVGVPARGVEQSLHAIGGQITSCLGQRLPVLTGQRREQATHVGAGPPPRLNPVEPARDLREQLVQPGHQGIQILIGHHKIDNLHDEDHQVLLEYKQSRFWHALETRGRRQPAA